MTTRKKWPTYRRTMAPAGFCLPCWRAGGAPVPGNAYQVGWPATVKDDAPPMYLCDRCLPKWTAQGWRLRPLQEGVTV